MQRFLFKHIVSEHLFYFVESVTYVLLHYTPIIGKPYGLTKKAITNACIPVTVS